MRAGSKALACWPGEAAASLQFEATDLGLPTDCKAGELTWLENSDPSPADA